MWKLIKKLFLYALGIVPGLVQAHLNAPYRGSLYFILFLLFVNTAGMSRFWISEPKLQALSTIISSMLAFVVWCHSYNDLILRVGDADQIEHATSASNDQPSHSTSD